MATVSFATLGADFDMGAHLVDFSGTVLSVTASQYSWQPTGGLAQVLGDSPFPVTLNPSTGTINSFKFTFIPPFEPLDPPAILITGLSLSLATFISTLNSLGGDHEKENNYIWRTFLAGDDTFDFGPGLHTISFAGDARIVEDTQTIFAGNDSMTGAIGAGFGDAEGDARGVSEGGTLLGGDDTIHASGGDLFGDTYDDKGRVLGGDDDIIGSDGAYLSGDARSVWVTGILIGGNDTVVGGGRIWGDTGDSRGLLVGGNDSLVAGDGAANMFGDAQSINSGSAIGGNDTLVGGSGGDTIYGDWSSVDSSAVALGGNDLIVGNAGNDTIHGNDGNDTITGGADVDQVFGDEGNDKLHTRASDIAAGETYDGGAGTGDKLVIENASSSYVADFRSATLGGLEALVFGDPGDTGLVATVKLMASQIGPGLSASATVDALGLGFFDTTEILDVTMGTSTSLNLSTLVFTNWGGVNDHVVIGGGTVAANIIGSVVNDSITGGALDDTIRGGLGVDTLDGGTGLHDTLDYSDKSQAVVMTLGIANVTVGGSVEDAAINFENVTGGNGADELYGNSVANALTGGSGNDWLSGGGSSDTLNGGANTDTADYSDKSAKVTVTLNASGNGTASIGAETDTLTSIENLNGGSGGDSFAGVGNVANSFTGNAGNDTFKGGLGNDTLEGGANTDTADYSDKTAKVTVVLNNSGNGSAVIGAETDILTSIENIIGGSAGDSFTGGSAANAFNGNGGADTLIGGLGNDTLTGGAGTDFFRFNAALGPTNIDTITDFSHTDDTIQLDNAVMTALGSIWSTAQFRATTSGHSAASTSQHIIYDKSNGTLWYDSNGSTGGSANAVQIAQLGTTAIHPTNVDYTDFAII